jgi:uncharacterized protein (UPF0332 family)
LTPEAAQESAAARRHLTDAKAIAGLDIAYVAAREAYIAAFHAAEAFLHDRTGSLAKTHPGLRTEFARLTRAEPRIDPSFSRFLANAYEMKSVADYGVEPASVSSEAAKAVIDTAEQMIDAIAKLLGPNDGPIS